MNIDLTQNKHTYTYIHTFAFIYMQSRIVRVIHDVMKSTYAIHKNARSSTFPVKSRQILGAWHTRCKWMVVKLFEIDESWSVGSFTIFVLLCLVKCFLYSNKSDLVLFCVPIVRIVFYSWINMFKTAKLYTTLRSTLYFVYEWNGLIGSYET